MTFSQEQFLRGTQIIAVTHGILQKHHHVCVWPLPCVLLITLKLHSYIYSDLLGGDKSYFSQDGGVVSPPSWWWIPHLVWGVGLGGEGGEGGVGLEVLG